MAAKQKMRRYDYLPVPAATRDCSIWGDLVLGPDAASQRACIQGPQKPELLFASCSYQGPPFYTDVCSGRNPWAYPTACETATPELGSWYRG